MSKFRFTLFSNVVHLAVLILLCLLCVPLVGAQTTFSCTDVTEIPAIECEALVVLYHSRGDNNWDESGWLQTSNPCLWEGVTCSDDNTTLVELYFGFNNKLESLPPEIGNLTNLTTLLLNFNRLESLPPEIGNLTNLTTLSLHSNRLESLPPEIGNLINLTDLTLEGNDLTSVPPEVGNLINLLYLSLSYNQLTSVPPEIGNLIDLAYLSLASNDLISVPPEIGNLINLTYLSLNYNQLTSVPAEIGNLDNLTILYLGSNQLTSLPAEIGNLISLTSLAFNGNLPMTLPVEILNLINLDDTSSWNDEFGNIIIEMYDFACINASPAAIEAWSDATGLPNFRSCSPPPTAVTIHSAPHLTTSPISILCLALFFIGAYSTRAIVRQQ